MSSKRATQLVCILHEGREITASVSCVVTQTDLGVPRSPVFNEYDEFEIESIEIDGEDATEAYAAGAIPKARIMAVLKELQDQCWVHGEDEE